MSVSSSSNFLRERHRTRHCYLSGIHIIYRTEAWYLQDSSWDHHSQLLFGRTILKYTLAFILRKKAYTLLHLYFTRHLYSVLSSSLNSAVIYIYSKIYIFIQMYLTVHFLLYDPVSDLQSEITQKLLQGNRLKSNIRSIFFKASKNHLGTQKKTQTNKTKKSYICAPSVHLRKIKLTKFIPL